MSSSAALVIFLCFSIVLLGFVSKLSALNWKEINISSKLNLDSEKVPFLTLTVFLLSSVFSIILSTYNFTSFGVDYDSMSAQLNFLIKDKIEFQMWSGRFFPLSHVDNAILLKLFKSFTVLKVYLALHFIALITIAYFTLDFIPKNRRLILLSLIAISPPIVNIYSSAIYSERNILLLLFTSLFFLRLGSKGVVRKKIALFLSLSSFFISLYFKETTIMYAGAFWGLFFITRNFQNFKSFNYLFLKEYVKKPLNHIEIVFLIPCLLWLISFILLGGELNPEYVTKRDNSLVGYINENYFELVFISVVLLITALRSHFDLYSVLIFSCVPMVIYCLFIIQATGAYNIFTYYNYLIYLAFSIYIVSTDRVIFRIIAPLTFGVFTMTTIIGFVTFSEKVKMRNEIVEQAVTIIRKETLNIDLEKPWEERNLARLILHKADYGHINHLTKHDLFCKDFNLYDKDTLCTTNENSRACKTLINTEKSSARLDGMEIVIVSHKGCK